MATQHEGIVGTYGVADERVSVASMADWHDILALDISSEAGDVVVATKWPGYILKGFMNSGASDGNVLVKFAPQGTALAAVTIPLDAHATTPKLPPVHTIVKTGSLATLLCFFQKRG
jgi:hypothetical protein